MKLSLQLKMGQQLTITPQLQQAIRLLQLSTLDLQQEIQEALDSNPLLELEEVSETTDSSESSSDDNQLTEDSEIITGASTQELSDREGSDDFSIGDNWEDKDIPSDLAVDSCWEDIYTNTTSPLPVQFTTRTISISTPVIPRPAHSRTILIGSST